MEENKKKDEFEKTAYNLVVDIEGKGKFNSKSVKPDDEQFINKLSEFYKPNPNDVIDLSGREKLDERNVRKDKELTSFTEVYPIDTNEIVDLTKDKIKQVRQQANNSAEKTQPKLK